MFWNEASRLWLDIHGPWIRAEDWLSKQSSTSQTVRHCQIGDAVYAQLGRLPWNIPIEGFTHPDPTHKLVRFLGKTWLSDNQMNQQLDLLRKRLKWLPSPHGLKRELVRLEFTQKILQAYHDCADESRPYESARGYRWVRDIGNELMAGIREQIGGFLHVSTEMNMLANHWVAFMVDFKQSCWFYGDSMGIQPQEQTQAALQWWLRQHSLTSFELVSMPCTQQVDGHSCGVLAANALAHHLFPIDIQLLDAKEVDYARMDTLRQVIEHHNALVSSTLSFPMFLTNMN
ncbi:hypothetical protein JB92DRAFT_2756243 [Gautieria morchelliformis]|nr:hypothetical protein JB92DRAFT_2756243 [Gautieria morchelliformis]